jgi:hypothetical protein
MVDDVDDVDIDRPATLEDSTGPEKEPTQLLEVGAI